jgi:hypothetical protein
MSLAEKIRELKDGQNLRIDYWDIWYLHEVYLCFGVTEDYIDEFLGCFYTPEQAEKRCYTAT